MKQLFVFDFDATLINTMLPDPGKKIWLEKTGEPWNHRGWWGRAESLDTNIFEHPRNEWVFNQYKKACEIEGSHKIVLTGRITNLVDKVEELLHYHDITEMDEILCNGHFGKVTRTEWFKINALGKYIKEHGDTLERVVMYDDREEHFSNFKKWGQDTQKRTGIKVVMDKIVDGVGRYEI